MKTTIKEFLPGTSFNNNGITYFRLENGNIAVEKKTNIIYDFSKDTIVEIVAVSKGFKIFIVNNYGYNIAPCFKGYKILDSNIEFKTFGDYINFLKKYYVDEEAKNKPIYLHNGFEILKVHCTDVYPEGRYVIYSDNSGYIGLFYLSDTEISDIFRPTRYIDIIFSNGYFFCKKRNEEFVVFAETLQYVGTTSSICEIPKQPLDRKS